jgi:hypothetical protein
VSDVKNVNGCVSDTGLSRPSRKLPVLRGYVISVSDHLRHKRGLEEILLWHFFRSIFMVDFRCYRVRETSCFLILKGNRIILSSLGGFCLIVVETSLVSNYVLRVYFIYLGIGICVRPHPLRKAKAV